MNIVIDENEALILRQDPPPRLIDLAPTLAQTDLPSPELDEIELVRATGLLDESFYLAANQDVAASGEGAVDHFCRHGWREGRNPNPYFDVAWYSEQIPPEERGTVNPVLHYVRVGEAQGLRPVLFFDPSWYRANYELPANESPLRHYLANLGSGRFSPIPEIEAVRATGLLDESFYLGANQDVATSGERAVEHFCRYGWREGRNPNPYFDIAWYSEQMPLEERGNVNPVLHYVRVGEAQGLRPVLFFDPSWYRANYELPANESPLRHYLANLGSGRFSPIPEFDVSFYLDQSPDLRAANIDPFMHYVQQGFRQGRDPASNFGSRAYMERFLANSDTENPLLHLLRQKSEGKATTAGFSPAAPSPSLRIPEASNETTPTLGSSRKALIPADLRAALGDPLIFDLSFYRRLHCPDLQEADAVIHFLTHPTRQASPYFDPAWYLEQNPDVDPDGSGALIHYWRVGRGEGRRPSPIFNGSQVTMSRDQIEMIIRESGLFDPRWYLHKHGDIARAATDPLKHYAAVGHKEGRRSPNVMFDPGWYRRLAPEVEQYGWNPLVHYILAGSCKMLTPHPLFEVDWFEANHGHDGTDRSALAKLLHGGIQKSVGPNQFFDPDYYIANCPEAQDFPGGAFGHYVEVGWKLGLDPSELFSTSGYLGANPDVRASGNNPLSHFVTSGRAEGRNPKPLPTRFRVELERFSDPEYGAVGPLIKYDAEVQVPENFGLSVAVHLHLYYAEIAEEFCSYLSNIPVPFDLFVSVPPGRGDPEAVRAIFVAGLANCANVIVESPPNRGRDVGPLLITFGERLLAYDVLLHLHSKRSPHSPKHADWRRYLLHYTLGNRAVATQILTAFHADPRIGIFQPPYHPSVQSQPKWGENRGTVIEILERFGLCYVGESCPDFPAGSFFWARSDALRPLLDGRLRLEDFDVEAGQIDGTLAHAVERLFGLIPVLRGYSTICRFIDVAHNLTHYYGKSRAFQMFERDRNADIIAYQDAVRARDGNRGRIAVVTAIIGPFDALLLPYCLEPDIDYYCVSDSASDGYGVFRIMPPPYVDADPRRTARYVKTNLLRLFPGYDFVVWIDANVLARTKISDFVAATEASGCPVGAIPHPTRGSYLEEATVAIEMNLDDPELIRQQIKKYEGLKGLDGSTLIETNFMVFDARKPQALKFMQFWWNEINTYSRRDQLSVNYSLLQANVAWHPLLHEYLSVRDSGEFSLFRHGLNEWGPKPHIYAVWYEPYAHEGHLLPLADQHRWSKRAGRLDLDVVICVYNALDDVRLCLASVKRALGDRGSMIIVDDASEGDTAQFLDEFSVSHGATLIRHETRLGYTKAANVGVRAGNNRNVILLNSDTVVPPTALEKLSDALDRDPLLGIVGPLSNAASFQSVPSNTGTASQTAVNQLPVGMSEADLDLFLERRWDGHVIRTPLVHGFCFGVKRAVFGKIAMFDEQNFPRGYGEENDFCFRAADAGFDLGVLTSTYVFHSKSKSYGEGERIQLMDEGMAALIRKATKPRITRAVETMQRQPGLIAARDMVAPLFTPRSKSLAPRPRARLFLMPALRSDGLPAGSGYVRVLLPYRSEAISQNWEPIELRSPKLPELRPDDTVLVQRDAGVIGSDVLEDWIASVRRSGARLVYEIDDDLLDRAALGQRGFRGDSTDLSKRVMAFSRAAHCVTVSSDALKTKFGMVNRDTMLVPNALDANLWHLGNTLPPTLLADAAAKHRGRVTIGYIGTPTHDKDLAVISEVISELRELFGQRLDIQVIGGFGHGKSTFGRVIKLPLENDYPSFVRWLRNNVRWDVGVIPLASSTFNANKSYLKFLECAALGMALVCSNGPEYSKVVRHNENGLLVRNDKKEWIAALCNLIRRPDERRRLALAAFDDVRRRYSLEELSPTLRDVVSHPAQKSAASAGLDRDPITPQAA